MSPEEWLAQQPQQELQTQQSNLSPEEWLAQNKPKTNPLAAFAKQTVEEAPKAALSLPFAQAGAAALAPLGPLGMVAGGIGGAGLGYLAAEKGLEALPDVPEKVKSFFGFSPEQRQAEREQNPAATFAGNIAAGVGVTAPMSALDRGVHKFAANKWWGEASPTQKQAWATADEWGYKLKPSQLREDSKAMIISNKNNQLISNQKAAEATGYTEPVTHVDQKFINKRFDALGKEYERIYNDPSIGAKITLDQPAQEGLTSLFVNQIPMPTAAKNRIVQALDQQQQLGSMSGEDFRFITSELKKVMRTSNDGNITYAIGDTLDAINKSIANTNPQLAQELAKLNPQWRSTVTLQNARVRDIIDENGNIDAHALGKMLRDDRNNPLYKLGSVGEALGIGTTAKADRLKHATGEKTTYIPGVSWITNAAKAAGRAASDSPALVNMMRKAQQQPLPPKPTSLGDMFRRSATYGGGPTINQLFNIGSNE